MVKWTIRLSRQAIKDAKKLAKAGYKAKAEKLLRMRMDCVSPGVVRM